VTVLIKSESIQQRSRFQIEKYVIKCRKSNAIKKNNFSTHDAFHDASFFEDTLYTRVAYGRTESGKGLLPPKPCPQLVNEVP